MASDDEVVAASASAEAISESVVLVWDVTVMKLVLPILSDGFLLDALLLMLALGIQRLGDGLGLIDGRVHVEAQLRATRQESFFAMSERIWPAAASKAA